ncbi:MAG: hypothetical protein RL230_494 [Pseudomonadota bacterium]|jgi:putative CocE/NonD family hydrolase
MRDGITLHCQVFLPAGRSHPVPIVMEMTPYGIDISVPAARRFTEAGLGLALIDCRGRGSSDGEFEMFETDINDTADAIDWLANQSWCDGQVAMRGGSYSGINQWIAAKSRHPALKGIAPWGAAYPGIDVPPGGVPFVGHLGWHVLTSGRDTQWQLASDSEFWMERLAEAYRSNRNIADLAEELGVSRLAFYSALRDPFYAMRNMTFLPTEEDMGLIDIPILSSTGHYDSTHAGTLYHFMQHERFGSPQARAKHHLVMTPWHHSGMEGTSIVGELNYGTAANVDMGGIRLEWYRWIFGMGEKPAFLSDRIVYYMSGVEEWRGAADLSEVGNSSSSWYLCSGPAGASDIFHSGNLVTSPEDSPADRFVADPFDSQIIEVEMSKRQLDRQSKRDSAVMYPDPIRGMHLQIAGEDPTDQAFAYNLNGQGVIYHSLPLAEDLDIAGVPELDMWLTLSTPDTDVVALLSEIRPEDGQSILLWSNILRLRYRNSWQTPELAKPGEPFQASFFVPRFISRRVKKGSRLRLVLRTPGSIYFQKNLNSGKPVFDEKPSDAVRCVVLIHHDGDMQTILRLPVAAGSL